MCKIKNKRKLKYCFIITILSAQQGLSFLKITFLEYLYFLISDFNLLLAHLMNHVIS